MDRAFSPYSNGYTYPGRCRISCFAGNPALAWAGIASRLRHLGLWRATRLDHRDFYVRLALQGLASWAIFFRPCPNWRFVEFVERPGSVSFPRSVSAPYSARFSRDMGHPEFVEEKARSQVATKPDYSAKS
jgi:hypothetical protein